MYRNLATALIIGLLGMTAQAGPGTSDDAADGVRGALRRISRELAIADGDQRNAAGKISALDTQVKTLEAIYERTKDGKEIADELNAARADAATLQTEMQRLDQIFSRLHTELTPLPIRNPADAATVRELMGRVASSMSRNQVTVEDLSSVQRRIAFLLRAIG